MDPDLKEWVKKNSCVSKEEERFSVYELNTTTLREDEERKIREVSVGPENDLEVKTVLMVGESGAGKTTFLNAFLNVVFGVNVSDDVRLQLKEQRPHCHTTLLIHHQKGMPYPFNYKVVDTLGLGDDDHDDHDDQANQKALKKYLSNGDAISHLNCVALIWKSSNRRLDERSQEILSKVKNLMSPDLESLTDVLLTFSSHEDSSAVGAIEESEVAFHKVFNFDNGALYQCPKDKKRQMLHALVWNSMVENQQCFLEELNQSQPKSLTKTAKYFAAQAELEDALSRVNEIRNEIDKEKELVESLERKNDPVAHEVKCSEVQELAESYEEIELIGQHCHCCKVCKTVCVQVCEESHDTRIAMVNDSDLQVNSYSTYIKSMYDLLRKFLAFFTRSVADKEATHFCQTCSHGEDEHERRDKIPAIYGTEEQRETFLKRKKSREIERSKMLLFKAIDLKRKNLEELEGQRETLEGHLLKKRKLIEDLQS